MAQDERVEDGPEAERVADAPQAEGGVEPAVDAPEAAGEPEPEADPEPDGPEAEPEPVDEPGFADEPEPEPVVEPESGEPEPEPVVEPESVEEPEPEPEPVDQPESVDEPEPEPVVEPESVVEQEPDAPEPEPEPERVVEPESVVEPEPEPVVEPASVEPEPEPIVEPASVEPEPEPIVEPESVEPEQEPEAPEPEPEPGPVAPVPVDPAPPVTEPDLADAPAPGPGRARRIGRTLAWTAGGLVIAAGVYVGALWLLADRVPTGTLVAGVDIGGLGAAAAEDRLVEGLASASTDPIPVTAGDKRTSFDPVAAGLTLDAEATVAQVTGFGLEPSRLWHHVFGGVSVEPVTRVDDAALDAALDDAAAALATEPVDGTVAFVDERVVTTAPAEGSAVDVPAARDLMVTGWLTAPRPLALPTEVLTPQIDQAEVDRVVREVAGPVADGPVTIEVAGQSPELPASVLIAAASFVPSDGELALEMDGETLVAEVTARTTDLLTPAADATFTFVDDAPSVVPGTPGTTLDPEALAEAVAAATSSPDRTATVELVPAEPEESEAELAELGITAVVSEFSTPLTSEPRRTVNITNGAEKISGTLIRPGETFSLTEELGPIDSAHGYVQAGAIVNGEHTDAWGGGLSQVSTTTYNAAYFAGMELVEHTPHSEWFSRYPEGREATIFTGLIDMQWRNNTPYGALVQAFVADGRLHVRIWSTPYWTVESSTSGRWGVVSPTTVYSQSPTCSPQSAGNPGFSVEVTRRVLLAGVLADEESWVVTYRPQNRVVCGAEPATP